jgi:uncharacterized protein
MATMTTEITDSARNGIRVFGSAIIRVAPDIATILVAVTRIEQHPPAAFAAAREAAQSVNEFFRNCQLSDVGASRITLSQEFRYGNGENRFVGYKASIGYSIVLRDMYQVEATITGLIEAGANELKSVNFQTSRLRELRAEARRRAIAAAKEKAEVYCHAAGVAVGKVLAIKDENPERLSGRSEGHVIQEAHTQDEEEIKAVDPAAIAVGAAVRVVYAIEGK